MWRAYRQRAHGRRLAGPCFFLAAALSPATARADVSSWLFIGPGASHLERRDASAGVQRFLFQLDTGLGTPPADPVVVGGLFRMQTHFSEGTDLALLVRTASRGFVNGDWGGALDLGGYQRFWAEGSSGFTGSLALGAPWGVTLSVGGSLGTNDARTFSAVLGIDFARLTVYRRTGDQWWKNPFPAYRPEEQQASRGPGI
jgi:hypothetical protein